MKRQIIAAQKERRDKIAAGANPAKVYLDAATGIGSVDRTAAVIKYNPAEIQAGALASWSQVKYWANIAGKFAQASLAAQVMAGFTLGELHKGIKAGSRTDLPTNLPSKLGGSDKPLTWPEQVEKFAGVSEETARKWMLMSDGIKARWKKLAPQDRLRELMRVPVSDWTDKDSKLVAEALKKVTDGSTQLEFMRELGLAKKPQGAGATGRLPGCDGTKTTLTLSEQVELRRLQAREDWSAAAKIHEAYKDKFVLLPDDEVIAQVATLEQELKARQAWLKQPVDQRDPKAIEAMFQEVK